MRLLMLGLALMAGSVLTGCGKPVRPIPPVAHVDLDRFMGDWYVLAHIPARLEREAFNAIESYRLGPAGEILTTFRFRRGAFDAPLKTYEPVGTVQPGTGNAIWGMQFIWPVEAEYVIVDLDPNYQNTIVGRSKRDYVWVMSRQPTMNEAGWSRVDRRLRELGYDTARLRRVPQRWPEAAAVDDR